MPDITMCSNKTCKLRYNCYRAMAKPDDLWQSWAKFDCIRDDNKWFMSFSKYSQDCPSGLPSY